MLYVQVGCPVCRTGVIGIRRCSDGQSFVLMCEECETVWASPEKLDSASALEAEPPNFVVQELGVAIVGGASGWATEAEVAVKGWGKAVLGVQPEDA